MIMKISANNSRITSSLLLLGLLLLIGVVERPSSTSGNHGFASAFSTVPKVRRPGRSVGAIQEDRRVSSSSSSSFATSIGPLFMSDVPQDDEDVVKTNKKPRRFPQPKNSNNNNRNNNNSSNNNNAAVDRWWKVPPPPEDQFVLIGDLLSLTVYGISDHMVCQIMSHHMVPTDEAQIVSDMVASSSATMHAPVWWEAASPQAAVVLQKTMESHLVTQYSPLLEPMGQATVLLAGTWLLAGWLHRAFLFQNTLDCPTDKALTVTARTWFTTCLLLFGLVVVSQGFSGMEDWATSFHRGDVDYIVDSLTVLVVWRFMASFLLGGFNK